MVVSADVADVRHNRREADVHRKRFRCVFFDLDGADRPEAGFMEAHRSTAAPAEQVHDGVHVLLLSMTDHAGMDQDNSVPWRTTHRPPAGASTVCDRQPVYSLFSLVSSFPAPPGAST